MNGMTMVPVELLDELKEFLRQRSDAEYHADSAAPSPNEAMKLHQLLDGIRVASANPCKYTGALVYFPDYDMTAPADIFEIAGCAIVRVCCESGSCRGDLRLISERGRSPITSHVATPGIGSWSRFDLGFVAMPSEQLEGPRR